ncbi:hypothetical protein lerEdw1_020061 [Lerista edwardsae]|nr:hypothetical protein lerEdw1_020061 [Lerista edwardsae]
MQCCFFLHWAPDWDCEVRNSKVGSDGITASYLWRQLVLSNKEGVLTFKRVSVPEIDMLFANIAETFSKQQDNSVALRKAIQSLKETYFCSPANSLAVCIEKIKQEHDACSVQVHMEGYRFWLTVKDEEVPEKLNQAEQQVRELDRATKGVISRETKLQEMISSVLQSQEEMVEKVKVANSEYLNFIRLEGNLRENLEKISLAKQLSKQYVEEAKDVLKEISKSASLTL